MKPRRSNRTVRNHRVNPLEWPLLWFLAQEKKIPAKERKEKTERKERKEKEIVYERVRNFEREKTRLASLVWPPTWTFVSRPEVHCYENQWSVRIRMKTRNVRKRSRSFLRRASSHFDGKWACTPEWQVAAPASRSEIRDAAPRGVEKEGEETPWEFALQDVRSILGGNIRPLVTHSVLSKNYESAPRYYPVEKEDSRWEYLSVGVSSMLNKLLNLSLSLPFVRQRWKVDNLFALDKLRNSWIIYRTFSETASIFWPRVIS